MAEHWRLKPKVSWVRLRVAAGLSIQFWKIHNNPKMNCTKHPLLNDLHAGSESNRFGLYRTSTSGWVTESSKFGWYKSIWMISIATKSHASSVSLNLCRSFSMGRHLCQNDFFLLFLYILYFIYKSTSHYISTIMTSSYRISSNRRRPRIVTGQSEAK